MFNFLLELPTLRVHARTGTKYSPINEQGYKRADQLNNADYTSLKDELSNPELTNTDLKSGYKIDVPATAPEGSWVIQVDTQLGPLLVPLYQRYAKRCKEAARLTQDSCEAAAFFNRLRAERVRLALQNEGIRLGLPQEQAPDNVTSPGGPFKGPQLS